MVSFDAGYSVPDLGDRVVRCICNGGVRNIYFLGRRARERSRWIRPRLVDTGRGSIVSSVSLFQRTTSLTYLTWALQTDGRPEGLKVRGD